MFTPKHLNYSLLRESVTLLLGHWLMIAVSILINYLNINFWPLPIYILSYFTAGCVNITH